MGNSKKGRKGRKVESVKVLTFVMTYYDDNSAQVVLSTTEDPQTVNMDDVTVATKYLMWIVSNHSKRTFEQTMEDLVRGASRFEGREMKVVPGGRANEKKQSKKPEGENEEQEED